MNDIKKIITLHNNVIKEKTFSKKVELNVDLKKLCRIWDIQKISREFYEGGFFIYTITSKGVANKFKIESYKKLSFKINSIKIL